MPSDTTLPLLPAPAAPPAPTSPPAPSHTCYNILIFLIVLLISLFFIDSLSTQYLVSLLSDTINSLLDQRLYLLTLLLFLFGAVSPLIGIPYTIFPVCCAFVYNAKLSSLPWALLYAFLLSSSAPLVGGSIAFYLGSTCLRDFAAAKKAAYPLFSAMDTIFDDPYTSVKMQLLLRLSPLIPAAALNYVLGASEGCSFDHFALAFFLGNSPYIFPLAYIGTLFTDATDLEDNDDLDIGSPAGISFAVVGVVCTIVATWFLTKYTKTKLEE
ncbi:hypothetical protein TeGR_g332, partial [Tetraparma gracilis]